MSPIVYNETIDEELEYLTFLNISAHRYIQHTGPFAAIGADVAPNKFNTLHVPCFRC